MNAVRQAAREGPSSARNRQVTVPLALNNYLLHGLLASDDSDTGLPQDYRACMPVRFVLRSRPGFPLLFDP